MSKMMQIVYIKIEKKIFIKNNKKKECPKFLKAEEIS